MMMGKYFVKHWLCVLATFALAACASNNVSELYEFYPVETNTDSKLFSYEFILDPAQRRSASARSFDLDFAVSFADMRDELETYMDQYTYCLEGYFVYDETFDGEKYALLGECQESKE